MTKENGQFGDTVNSSGFARSPKERLPIETFRLTFSMFEQTSISSEKVFGGEDQLTLRPDRPASNRRPIHAFRDAENFYDPVIVLQQSCNTLLGLSVQVKTV